MARVSEVQQVERLFFCPARDAVATSPQTLGVGFGALEFRCRRFLEFDPGTAS
jgi:hypothetical protein